AALVRRRRLVGVVIAGGGGPVAIRRRIVGIGCTAGERQESGRQARESFHGFPSGGHLSRSIRRSGRVKVSSRSRDRVARSLYAVTSLPGARCYAVRSAARGRVGQRSIRLRTPSTSSVTLAHTSSRMRSS